MSDRPRQPAFDPEHFRLQTQTDFYDEEDLECAARGWPRDEVGRAFAAYRAAIAEGDHETMAEMLAEGATTISGSTR